MSTMVKKKGLATGHEPLGKRGEGTPSVGCADTSPAGAGKDRKKGEAKEGTPSAPSGHLPRQDGGGTKRGAGKDRGKGKGRKKKAAGFVPIKGGDGGTPVKIVRGPDWAANARVVLTGASIRCKADRDAFELLLVATTDPCDRAHNEKKLIAPNASPTHQDSWVLCGLGEIDLPGGPPRSRPRRYHPSQVVGRPGSQVGIDSMFDGLARTAQRLQDAGIEMGLHTTRVGECSRGEQALRHLYEGVDWHTIRDRLEQKTGTGKADRTLDRSGDRYLRSRGYGRSGKPLREMTPEEYAAEMENFDG